jgi:hypothetical protein
MIQELFRELIQSSFVETLPNPPSDGSRSPQLVSRWLKLNFQSLGASQDCTLDADLLSHLRETARVLPEQRTRVSALETSGEVEPGHAIVCIGAHG